MHELTILDEIFIEKAGGIETKTSIEDIYDVCETDLHLFVYINKVSAHIIPKREITKDVVKILINLKPTTKLQAKDFGDRVPST